jgi:hypothetical protein
MLHDALDRVQSRNSPLIELLMSTDQPLDHPVKIKGFPALLDPEKEAALLLLDSSQSKSRPDSVSLNKLAAEHAANSSTDNSPLHLASVAVTSICTGFTEPLLGGAQLAEQAANKMGLKDRSGEGYFHPELLSPSKSSEPAIDSFEWYTKNIGENIGRLPWYLLASRIMRNPAALEGEALAVGKLPALGLSLKTAMSSGFILSAFKSHSS